MTTYDTFASNTWRFYPPQMPTDIKAFYDAAMNKLESAPFPSWIASFDWTTATFQEKVDMANVCFQCLAVMRDITTCYHSNNNYWTADTNALAKVCPNLSAYITNAGLSDSALISNLKAMFYGYNHPVLSSYWPIILIGLEAYIGKLESGQQELLTDILSKIAALSTPEQDIGEV